MTEKNKRYPFLIIALLLCFLQVAGIDVYAQEPVQRAVSDSIRTAPKARARRDRPALTPQGQPATQVNDTLKKAELLPIGAAPADSLALDKLVADSLANLNKANMEKLESKTTPAAPVPFPADSVARVIPKKQFLPNPTKATWLALVLPGAGQIYNRKFWKLPIVYGGFAGCAYALSWNSKMYKDYSRAYMDIMDNDPNTNSYLNLIGGGRSISESQLKERLKNQKDMYRRYRDLSIFAMIGVYIISVIDAYVDAELSDFDITPDLSMRIEPAVMNMQARDGSRSVGVQCSFRF